MTATLSPDQRLKNVQAELERRGVVSIGLTLSPSAKDAPLDEVKADVANFFEAYLEGRTKPLTDFGDPPVEQRGVAFA